MFDAAGSASKATQAIGATKGAIGGGLKGGFMGTGPGMKGMGTLSGRYAVPMMANDFGAQTLGNNQALGGQPPPAPYNPYNELGPQGFMGQGSNTLQSMDFGQ